MFADLLEGDLEGDMSLQHEGTSQEHVGTQTRVQTLQGAEVELHMRPLGDGQCIVVYAHIATM